MIILETLEKTFNILLPFALIVAVITGIKEKVVKENEEIETVSSEENSWKSKVETFIVIVSLIVLLGLIGILWIKYKITWIILVFAFPAYIERIIEAYISIGIVRDVVSSTKKEKLSYREKSAIGAVAYIVWLGGVYDCFEKVIKIVREYPNTIISDISIIVCYVFAFFIYIFFICSLLPSLIFCFIDILKKANNSYPYKQKIEKCENYFIERCEKSIKINSILIKCIDKIIKAKFVIKIAVVFFLPIAFIRDIIVVVCTTIFSIIRSVIGYIFLLLRLFKRTIKRSIKWISKLSDKRIVVLSFRVAFVMALAITVIINRYQPLLKNYEESTSVLEFVASSIIIPVIFEWIYSIRQQEKDNI